MRKKSNNTTKKKKVAPVLADNSWLRSAVGIIFILLAVFTVIVYFGANYIPTLAGAKNVLKLALGKCWFMLPVLLGIIGSSIFSNEDYDFFSLKNLFLFLLLLVVPAICHHFNVPVGKALFPEVLKDAKGGGFIGGMVILIFQKFFDSNIIFIILVALLLTCSAFLLPYRDIFRVVLFPLQWLKKFLFKKLSEDDDEYLDDDTPDDDFEDEFEEVSESKEDEPVTERKMPSFESKNRGHVSSVNSVHDGDDFLSARSIIANRKHSDKESKKQEEKSVIEEIYNRKQFKGFSDGVRKENILKRIMSRRSDDNVYNQPGVRENLKENPMDIPNWQGDNEEDTHIDDRDVTSVEQIEKPVPDSRDQKVIPLYSDDGMSDGNVAIDTIHHKDSVVVKHYRENAADDIGVGESARAEQSPFTEKPKLSRIRYKYPKSDLLDKPKHLSSAVYERDIKKQCALLTQTFEDFGVNAKVVGVTRGPSITRFEVEPAPGVKVSSITSLADDIALKLAAGGVRIEAPIPGKAAIGIEVPNIQNDAVYFKEIVEAEAVKKDASPLCLGLGKDVSGDIITIDLIRMPHLLVAGATGSGKSVCINTLISGILYKAHPEEVKLILIDPKVVELSNYNGIPHLLTPVVTDPKKAASALQWACLEMNRRYHLFADNHAREINSYNLGAKVKLPYIVIIIDELSDLMMAARSDVEDAILALAQKARAAGIHLVLATQRPSVDVITGVIKSNIPSRISFAVSSQIDSRTILDVGGAEKLIGKGDMLFYPASTKKLVRVQGAFISDQELGRIIDFVTSQNYQSDFLEEITNQKLKSDTNKSTASSDSNSDDDIFLDVVRLVMDTGQVSASMLQRKFRVGYTRAARLVDTLEELGIVGQASGSKPRELIISRQEIENRFFNE